jgi:hypothetical protein
LGVAARENNTQFGKEKKPQRRSGRSHDMKIMSTFNTTPRAIDLA